MQYVRIYATPDGESHLADVEVAMQDAPSASMAMAARSSESTATTAALFSCLADPAEQRGVWQLWHPAPRRQFAVRLTGEWEGEVSDGAVRRLNPGSVLLAKDTTGRGHRIRILSDGESQTLFIPLAD